MSPVQPDIHLHDGDLVRESLASIKKAVDRSGTGYSGHSDA
jgi:hypothetical protein